MPKAKRIIPVNAAMHLVKIETAPMFIYLSVQKEFARRLIASAGSKDYGAFSCFVQYYTKPEVLFGISRNSFFPRPKVDSCFIKLEPRRESLLPKPKEQRLFRIIRKAFGQRRKTLKNSLQGLVPEQKIAAFLTQRRLNPRSRPEELSLQDFIFLAGI
jgi:16S rRNA (adenine1518-N6/adenine1519-N6)-dimethyltransferase